MSTSSPVQMLLIALQDQLEATRAVVKAINSKALKLCLNTLDGGLPSCQTLEKQCSPPNHAELEGRSCGDQLQQDWLGQSDGSRRLAEDATQVHKFPAPSTHLVTALPEVLIPQFPLC